MELGYKYYAFISYKREDEEWAKWIQYEFEHYHLPSTLNGREDLPTEFRPVFRDTDELSAGNLPAQISDALDRSAYLIVVCSPQAAQSEWVNREILDFIELGKRKGIDNISNIFPFIVKGVPHSAEASMECFPKALRDLPLQSERIGGNINETGRDKAFIKIMAGTLRVSFDSLWNRYEKEKIEEEQRRREERNRLLLTQSCFLAEKAVNFVAEGDSYKARLLSLEALPKKMDDPDERPWCPEAEAALRLADKDRSAILRGHSDKVQSVACNSDGSLIASVSGGKVFIWDALTGNKIREFEGYNFVAFSPDGKILLTVSFFEIRLWDLKNGNLLYTFEVECDVESALFDSDGTRIVLAGRNGLIIVWDVIGRKVLLKIAGHGGNCVNYASFSPDGKKIVSASSDETVRIWDANSGRKLGKLSGHTGHVYTAVFSPDGRRVLSASGDRTVREWDVESGKMLSEFKGHTHIVNSAKYNVDGSSIVSSSYDGTIRVWRTDTKEEMYVSEKQPGSVFSALFKSDNSEVVFGVWDGTVRILKVNDYACNWLPDSVPIIGTVASFSPDGRWIAHVDHTKIIGIFDVETRKELYRLEGHTERVTIVTFSPDSQLIVSAAWDNTMRVWSANNGEEKHVLKGHTGIITSVSFSPDGKRIISSSLDNTVRIWDVMNGKMLEIIEGFAYGSACAMFSPDGKLFLTYDNAKMEIWDAQSYELLHILDAPAQAENPIAFSPGCELIVTLTFGLHGELQIWDAITGEKVGGRLEGHGKNVTSISFSPDGVLLATASKDRTVRIWNVADGKELHVLVGHASDVTKVSFSSDGKRIFSASDSDGTAMVWDVESGKVLLKIKEEIRTPNQSVLFSPCGGFVLFCRKSYSAYLKKIEPLQELMDRCRERFKERSLMPEERKMYYLE